MNFEKRVETLHRLDDLIRRKFPGSYDDLAQRLNVSRATLYRHLKALKSYGAPVIYDRHQKKFYYETEFALMF